MLAPMAGASPASLSIAVANAGGMGAMGALLTTHATEELMLRIRREVDGQLSSYRRKMKAEQLAQVEKKYTQKRLLEEFGLPRLSLYYFS